MERRPGFAGANGRKLCEKSAATAELGEIPLAGISASGKCGNCPWPSLYYEINLDRLFMESLLRL